MRVSIKIKDVNTINLKRKFAAMSRRSRDFSPVFRWAMQELQKAHQDNFNTNGGASGSPWKPLDPQYSSWKISNYGSKGVLVRTGALENSLTMNSGRGAVRDIGRTSAEFGTSLPYAKFHQVGTTTMAQRKVVFLPVTMAQRTANVVAEYIVHGTMGVVYSDAMRGFVA